MGRGGRRLLLLVGGHAYMGAARTGQRGVLAPVRGAYPHAIRGFAGRLLVLYLRVPPRELALESCELLLAVVVGVARLDVLLGELDGTRDVVLLFE